MKCEELEVLISAYIDGELKDDERRIVEEHLVSCDECGELLADFSLLHTLSGELEEIQAPKGFRERVTQRIDRPSRSWFRQALTVRGLRYAASLVLLLLFAGGVWVWQMQEPISQQAGETLLAGEIEVFAEDFLFGDASVEESDLFSSEDGAVADDILNELFSGASDTSGISEHAQWAT